MRPLFLAASLPLAALAGCPTGDSGDDCDGGLAVLGCGEHGADNVRIDVIGTRDDGLDVPRDLAFNPDEPRQLWTVNRADDSVVVYFDPGTEDQRAEHIIDPYAFHFMEEVSSIAFGAPGTFGTCQESRNTYDGSQPANDFMGPALWSSDLDVFGQTNPDAVDFVGFDLGSHLDMLHDSPYCMGIAWQEDNVYWVFDGFNSAIARYDFNEDHGPGFDDHGDGEIARYVEGEVDRVADVPSHMVLDGDLLYIADTGNDRIAVLDTTTGERGEDLFEPEFNEHYKMDGATLSTFVRGADFAFETPSGLAMHDGLLFVSDNENSNILAFSMDGELIDWLELDRRQGALMGIEFDGDGNLWVVDAEDDELIRIRPAE